MPTSGMYIQSLGVNKMKLNHLINDLTNGQGNLHKYHQSFILVTERKISNKFKNCKIADNGVEIMFSIKYDY